MKTVGVILGSGAGGRFGASFPKQFMSLNGKMIIQHSIDAMVESKQFDYIICTVPCQEVLPNSSLSLKNVDEFIIGGKTRTETILNVLEACPENTEYIVFHDSVRPFIKSSHFKEGLKLLRGKKLDYLVTAQKITDALIHFSENGIFGASRDLFRLCQTPEFFDFESLKNSKLDLINSENYTYIAETLGSVGGYKGDILEYNDNNLKITYEKDLYNAEQLMKYTEIDESNEINIEGKHILIFGGSGDIGKNIKKDLENRGAIVYTPSRAEFDLFNPKKKYLPTRKFDCIIYSGGAYSTDEQDLMETYDEIMNVNFKSVIKVVSFAENNWLKQGGNIILLGSTCAGYGRKGISLYSASKSALNAFVEAYQHKLMEKDIKINVIAPAKVQGKLQKNINPNANQNKMIKPERLAEIISHYVTTDKTGQIVYVRYGLEEKK